MLSIDFASRSSLFMGTCAAPGRRFRRVFSINLSVFQRSRGKSRVENLNEQIACEQALLFGQAKRVSRERASEGPRKGFAARSRVLARLVSLAQIGELARRLPSSAVILGTFSTDGFQDGYGELDRAGTGDTRPRPRKSPRK